MINDEFIAEEIAVRLDVLLRNRYPEISRNEFKLHIAEGRVKVNNKRVSKSCIVKKGDIIKLLNIPQKKDKKVQPDNSRKIYVIYEDSDFVGVIKEPGIPSAPFKWDEKGTMLNFTLAKYPEVYLDGRKGIDGGLLYRLDTPASGILLFARSPESFNNYHKLLKQKRVIKTYFALVHGIIENEMVIDVPILFLRGREKKVYTKIPHQFKAAVRKKYRATTKVIPVESKGLYTLVKAIVHSATRHQLRAHLSHTGHPIIGDAIYGKKRSDSERLYLHLGIVRIENQKNTIKIKNLPEWKNLK